MTVPWKSTKDWLGRDLWYATWPLALLCLVSGSRWVLDSTVPEARSTLASAAWGYGGAALTVLLWTLLRGVLFQRATIRPLKLSNWPVVGLGALVLAGPAVSVEIAGRHIGGNTGTVAMALTPVVAAVGVSAYAATGEVAGLLWPGLAGVAGLLLLLPFPDLSFWRTDLALASMPLIAGVGASAAGHRLSDIDDVSLQNGHSTAWFAPALAVASAVFCCLSLSAMRGGERLSVSFTGAAADGLTSWLTLMVLARLGAMRWSAQFLLAPSVTILEGIFVVRPALTMRSWMGIALLVLGGGYLLASRNEKQPAGVPNGG